MEEKASPKFMPDKQMVAKIQSLWYSASVGPSPKSTSEFKKNVILRRHILSAPYIPKEFADKNPYWPMHSERIYVEKSLMGHAFQKKLGIKILNGQCIPKERRVEIFLTILVLGQRDLYWIRWRLVQVVIILEQGSVVNLFTIHTLVITLELVEIK